MFKLTRGWEHISHGDLEAELQKEEPAHRCRSNTNSPPFSLVASPPSLSPPFEDQDLRLPKSVQKDSVIDFYDVGPAVAADDLAPTAKPFAPIPHPLSLGLQQWAGTILDALSIEDVFLGGSGPLFQWRE
ncbi:hypothetical protein BGZ82_000022 [Podila clonocystis]|nr:hypothetical protein BGZ82_000022 [Podila clonocystis]